MKQGTCWQLGRCKNKKKYNVLHFECFHTGLWIMDMDLRENVLLHTHSHIWYSVNIGMHCISLSLSLFLSLSVSPCLSVFQSGETFMSALISYWINRTKWITEHHYISILRKWLSLGLRLSERKHIMHIWKSLLVVKSTATVVTHYPWNQCVNTGLFSVYTV